MFDSSLTLVEAAVQGVGVALVPVAMFAHEIEQGRIVQPFDTSVSAGSYWLTRLKSRAETASMKAFRQWILTEIDEKASDVARSGTPAGGAGGFANRHNQTS